MLVYYKRSGVNAVLALFLNTVILLAALSYFKAVLTLPGIAGVILTIGMAVDSNVLIFERIREELRAGKAIVSAVDAGFSKAWWTIVDTHVTTVVSCAFLFIFGEGPVRGFAVTLTIGLIANVFTAVFVSKVIFDYELSGRRQLTELSIVRQVAVSGCGRLPAAIFRMGTNLKIRCPNDVKHRYGVIPMQIFKNTNFDFLRYKWPFIGASLVLSVAGIGSIISTAVCATASISRKAPR